MKIIYVCEICGREYENQNAAEDCEKVPMKDFNPERFTRGCHLPEVGDVVECSYPASSWWGGSAKWCVWKDYGGRFLKGYYALWVVVAKIPHGEMHEWKYILWSPSGISNNQMLVWTGPNHTPTYFSRKATPKEFEMAIAAYEEEKGRIPLL